MDKNRASKFGMRATLAIVAFILFAMPVLSFFNRQSSYSYFENRMLAARPALSISSVRDGSFFTGCENFLVDHIYQRDKWISGYTYMQMHILKKPVVNKIVLADDLLLPFLDLLPVNEYCDAMGRRAANDLSRLKGKLEEIGGKLVVIGVPEQYSVLADRFPYPMASNRANFTAIERSFFTHLAEAGIEAINMRPYYRASGDPTLLYAKTDHHYRLEGAYLAYTALCERLRKIGFEFPVTAEEDFDYVELPNDFLGSRAKRLYGLSPVKEKALIYSLKEDIPFARYDNG